MLKHQQQCHAASTLQETKSAFAFVCPVVRLFVLDNWRQQVGYSAIKLELFCEKRFVQYVLPRACYELLTHYCQPIEMLSHEPLRHSAFELGPWKAPEYFRRCTRRRRRRRRFDPCNFYSFAPLCGPQPGDAMVPGMLGP